MRTKGSAKELEVKRLTALRLLEQGLSRAQVAAAVGASWTSVNRWQKQFVKGGEAALAARPHPGRPPKLRPGQVKRVLAILAKGAKKVGFENELWTCPRVAKVIEQKFGVQYDESHVWRLLVSWGWSCQTPQPHNRQQDQEAVKQWRETKWPEIKKREPANKLASF